MPVNLSIQNDKIIFICQVVTYPLKNSPLFTKGIHIMKRITLIAGFILLITGTSKNVIAQYKYADDLYYDYPITYELGGSLGVMNCLTDLGGNKGIGKKFVKDLNLGKTQPAGSIFLSLVYKYAISIRAEATWGIVKGNDNVLKNVKESTFGRYERNLSFRSTIFDITLVTEIHPRYFKKYYKRGKLPRLSPYILGGIGFFNFNPQAKLNDQWIDLQPLSTEGQGFAEHPDRKTYKLKQINIPVGAGFKYKLSPVFNFSAEFVYRILNTDYLDDVSTSYIDSKLYANYFTGEQLTNALLLNNRQYELNPTHTHEIDGIRGNPKNNDAYFSFTIKLGFIF